MTVPREFLWRYETREISELSAAIEFFILTCVNGYVWAFMLLLEEKINELDVSDKIKCIIQPIIVFISIFSSVFIPKNILFMLIESVIISIFWFFAYFISNKIWKIDIERINKKLQETEK